MNAVQPLPSPHSRTRAPREVAHLAARPCKLFESVGQKIRLTVVMTGKWMSPLDDPVDVLRNVGKERASITSFKVFEK